MNGTYYLINVIYIRLLLILLLVFYHAFAIYGGSWPPVEAMGQLQDIKLYYWLDKLSYACLLEMFVFISGHVFGYQVRTKGESKLEAKNLLLGKFKRLLVPSMFFSLLYILLFEDTSQPMFSILYSIVKGVGHMWFLPMLFWCFLFVWIIERLHLSWKFILPTLTVLSLCSVIPLPLQLAQSFYYMLFFYVGYILQRENFEIKKNKGLVVAISFVVFAILFPLITIYCEDIPRPGGGNYEVATILWAIVRNGGYLLISTLGIIFIWGIITVLLEGYSQSDSYTIPKWLIETSKLCMGVYIFQQFILKFVWYNTTLPSILGIYIAPWVFFIITLIISLICSFIIRKTALGRFLIG